MKNIKLFNEYVNEAYDGKISDFKYDLEMALEEIGISSKAIKKVSKVGKKFEVRMSSYMSQRSTWEKIGELMGATLVDFKADPKSINVGLYESVKLEESVKVNEAKTSLDDMMKWIEKSVKFVKTSEEFDGSSGGIWVSGENGDRYKGKRIYDYYVQDPKNYELGVLKDWEKELNKRGWYSEWYDAGTVMIWPD